MIGIKKTGNLYIETKEKSNKLNPNFVDSGIYRDDNTWLFLIGNYEEIFIFSKKDLILMEKTNIEGKINRKTETSIGFTLNREIAERYCAKKINIL